MNRTPRTSGYLRRFLAVFSLFVCLNLLAGVSCAQEFRALWVDGWHAGAMSASEVTTLVSRCQTYNYNAVVVQMRRRGDAWYMPQAPNLEPRTTALTSTFDSLAEVIKQCHAAVPRIEVHCWCPTYLIWSDTANAPTQAGHVYNSHPEYLMKDSTGSTYVGEGYFLDPGNPDANMWNYNMAMDIVSRYDIDGFHWDYVRYPQQDAGYNATAIARYNAEFNLSGQPSASDSQFSTWRRRQITDFLRWANSDLLAVKPGLVISTAVFASRSDAYSNRFQDWAAWNSEGIIDVCMPMNYASDSATFNSRVDDAYNNRGVRSVYMGLGAYLNTASNTVTQLNYAKNKPLSGNLIYSYAAPNSGTVNQTGTFQYIKDNYQPTYVATPQLTWKANPTKGILKGTITREDTGAAIYNATVTLYTPTSKTQKTEPHGKYAFFESAPGTYTVEATASGLGTATGTATIVAGQVTNVNLIVPTTDTSAPTLSNVASANVTDRSALISWTTNEDADSVVEYGTSAAYGSVASDTAMVTNHSISLSGLSASTTYHFRVKSKDASANEGVSADYSFTTGAPGTVADIIVDNANAALVGAWTVGTSSTDKYGASYAYNGPGTGAEYATFTPNVLTPGDYELYEWHCQGSNRVTAAPHIIKYNGGQTTVNINQQINGGKWNLVGKYNFASGTTGYVRVTDAFSGSYVVIADAVKLVYAPAVPTAPAAPSALAATAASSSQINLSWTDNSSNEDNFIVARAATAGGPYTDIATLSANTTSYADTGLDASTAYYYVVRAGNSVGESGNSAEASATTQAPPQPPAAPSSLTATAASSSQINLSWTDNSANEDNFVVARATTAGGPYTDVATLSANVTSYSDTGLAGTTTYYYVVRAKNSVGTSANTNEASATTLAAPPAAPSSLVATVVSKSQINLTWTDNSNNETNFVVERKTGSTGTYSVIATLGSNVTSYSSTGLVASTTYYYRVKATNANGSSAYCAEAYAKTLRK